MLSCRSRCSSMSAGTVRENAVSSSCILVPEGPAACGGHGCISRCASGQTPPPKAPGPDADGRPGHRPRPGTSPRARPRLGPHGQGLTLSLGSGSRWRCGLQLTSSSKSAQPAPPALRPCPLELATQSLRQVSPPSGRPQGKGGASVGSLWAQLPTRPPAQAQIPSFLAVRLRAEWRGSPLRVCWEATLSWSLTAGRRWGPCVLENPRGRFLPHFFV